jgi:protein Mpv17
MVTGGILWGVGDAVAQGVPVMMQKNASTVPFEYDWVRTGRAAFYGFAIHAPLSHLHYNFLEYLTIKAGVKGLGITIFKTFMEQVRSCQLFSCIVCSFLLLSISDQ